MPNEWSEKIKRLKELREWSQCDIAQRIKIQPATVGTWERGERTPHKLFRDWIDEQLAKLTERHA